MGIPPTAVRVVLNTPSDERPRVSIVTAVYNDERYIEETIAGVRSQTFGSWEHILVDDGSVDSSAGLIEAAAAGDARLHLLGQSNTGHSTARNNGYERSRGSDYVLFLDHDDVLEPEMLEVMVAYLDRHPEVGVVYCDFAIIDDQGVIQDYAWRTRYRAGLVSVSNLKPGDVEMPFEGLLMWGGILPSNALIRRSLYDEAGGFDARYMTDDTDLFMRLALKAPIHYLNRKLVRYRRHDSQMSVDADRTSSTLDRLLREKWANAALTPSDRRRLRRGMSLRRFGAQALVGASDGWAHARAGRYRTSVRFLIGALRRYLLYVGANLGLVPIRY